MTTAKCTAFNNFRQKEKFSFSNTQTKSNYRTTAYRKRVSVKEHIYWIFTQWGRIYWEYFISLTPFLPFYTDSTVQQNSASQSCYSSSDSKANERTMSLCPSNPSQFISCVTQIQNSSLQSYLCKLDNYSKNT